MPTWPLFYTRPILRRDTLRANPLGGCRDMEYDDLDADEPRVEYVDRERAGRRARYAAGSQQTPHPLFQSATEEPKPPTRTWSPPPPHARCAVPAVTPPSACICAWILSQCIVA